MVVVTFRLALRVIDFAFVLHMKNVTGSLFQGTNSKELRALVRAYSKKEKEVDHLDDAESGKKKSGSCFGKARKPKNVYDPSDRKINDYSDVKLDPEQEKKFEQRAMHFIKVSADLERERAHLKKEIEHAMKSQTHRRKEVLAEKREVKAQKNQGNALSILKTAPAQSERTKTGGGSPLPSPRSRPTESDASPAAQAALDRFDENPKKSKALGILQKAPSMADRGVVHTGGTTAGAPQSPSATSPGAITPAAQAVLKRFESPSGMDAGMDAIVTPGKVKVDTSEWIDTVDIERVKVAKSLEQRTNALHQEQKQLAKDIYEARKARYESDRAKWMSEKRTDNAAMEQLASSPNSAMMLSSMSTKDSISVLKNGKQNSDEIDSQMKSTRRDDGDFDGFSDAHVVLILRRFAKGIAAYLFLAWFLKVWNADFTFFVAFSAVGALFVLFSLREAAMNVIGACVIVFYRAFVVGDWIKIECERTGGTPREGVVRDINFFFVTLTRVDDLTVIRVPNVVFLRRAVINVSRQHVFRHEFVIPATYAGNNSKGMDSLRLFMNECKKRVERVGEVINVWVVLDPDPLGVGGDERRVRVRFDFAHGPASPRNMNDEKPLSVAGIECRAWRAWLNFLTVRDNAMTVAIDAADGSNGVALGTMEGASSGAGGAIRALDVNHPQPGTNEGGYDAMFRATQRHAGPSVNVGSIGTLPSPPPPAPKPAPKSPHRQ